MTAQQQKIVIPFNPSITKPYEYELQTHANINGYYDSQRVKVLGTYSLSFEKKKDHFIATDRFSKLEILSQDKLIFSLNLAQEYYSRQRVLKDYFNTIPLHRKIDFKGTQTEGWDTSFILYYPEMGESDKSRILKVVNQLDAPLQTFYVDRPMTVGDTFTNDDIINIEQFNTSSIKTKVEATLLEVRDQEALFVFKSSFYIPERNRDKEIIGKKEVLIEGMQVVDIKSGVPIKARMVFQIGEDQVISTLNKKGTQRLSPGYLNYIISQQGETRSFSQPDKAEKRKTIEEITIPTKEKALEKLKAIIPFLNIEPGNGRGCAHISATTTQFKDAVRLYPKSIKGFIKDSLLFHQKEDMDIDPIFLYDHEWSEDKRMSASYCDLARSFRVAYECTLSMPYGIDKKEYHVLEYDKNADPELKTKIFGWKDHSITVKDQMYVEYYNEKNKQIFPNTIVYDFFNSMDNTLYGIPKEDITANLLFLLLSPFSSERLYVSYKYLFDEKVSSIIIYEPEGFAFIERTYELTIPESDE